MNLIYKRIIMAFIGVTITGASIGLFQTAALGTDPFTSFLTGFCNVFGVSFGILYTLACSVMLVAVFILDKRYIGVATFFNLFGNGIMADITREFLIGIFPNPSYEIRVLLLVSGVVIMCFAASLYFTADLGVSVYDAISIIMAEKKIAKFRTCRIITDSICVVVGFVLKASIGLGTVITALFMGPLIQWFSTKVAEPLLYGGKPTTIEKVC